MPTPMFTKKKTTCFSLQTYIFYFIFMATLFSLSLSISLYIVDTKIIYNSFPTYYTTLILSFKSQRLLLSLSLSLFLSLNRSTRRQGTDSRCFCLLKAIEEPWKLTGICMRWSEAATAPLTPPLQQLQPPPQVPPQVSRMIQILLKFNLGFRFLHLAVNKPVVIFSPWPILLKQEMLLKSCMNFISHSFPNLLSLFLPKVVNPSRLLFLLSIHHHQRNRLSSNSSSLIISSLMLVLSLVPQLLEPKEGKFSLYFAFKKKKSIY